jgi:formate hydrogenlyase subunit 3/multisubunit Na+/H+ antiporter MnhD subunit
MLSTALSLIGSVLLLTFVTSYMILQAAVPKGPLRKLMLFLVITTPFVAFFALIRVLFSRPKPMRYNVELGRIEDEIESERARMFGDKIIHPSFSEKWKLSYLYALEKSANTAVKLDPALDRSLCGIAHLQ